MLFQQLIAPTTDPLNTFGGNFDENALLVGVFKILFIAIALFYVVFAVIVIRQVQIMKNTLITPISPVLLIAGFIHLLLAIGVLLLFFVIL